jgi:hypothetical protein
MFDLGGRRGLGGGCKLPTAPPPARQRNLSNKDLFGEYSLVSNQARSEAGPPTGNIKFDLHKSAKQSRPFATRRLWVLDQADTHKWTAMKAPLLLTVPLVLFKAIQEEGKPLMPHKIRGLVIALIGEAADVLQASTAWDLILSWCILAAQQDMNGNSLLGLPVDAVTEEGNKYLAKWIDSPLDTMFGPRPSSGIPWNAEMWGGANPHDATQVSAMMATEVGKGMALGLWDMGQLQRDPSQLGGGYNAKTKGYTKDDIVALMGFARVYNGHNLPNIWELFNAAKGKKISMRIIVTSLHE